MTSPNVEVIRCLNTAFNAGDGEALQALIDPDVEFVDHLPLPDVIQEAHGIAQLTKVIEKWREGFVGFRADVVEYIDMGDYVVCSTRWNFVSRDEGVQLDWPGAEAYQVRDGKLIWSAQGFRDAPAAVEAVELRKAALA
jgi:ketosteroid isomerase-like protein